MKKLYQDNYIAPVFQSIRDFNNPFFIDSEQVLLNKILTNINNGIPLFNKQEVIRNTPQPAVRTSRTTNAPFSSVPINDDNDETELEDEINDPGDRDNSINVEADYYQSEVYKKPGTRVPYNSNEIIDEELGDTRHLIAYNTKDQTLHISHRGTDSISDLVTDLLAQRFFRLGDTKNIDFEDLTDFSTEKENIKYHIDIFEKAIDKYGKNVKVIFSGHSKGAYDLQTVVNYLENGYKGIENKHTADDIDYKAYLYNGYPFQFKGENTNMNIHPRRVEGDIVSYPYGREHPNLKTLPFDELTKDIKNSPVGEFIQGVLPEAISKKIINTDTMALTHSSSNFVNKDFGYISSKGDLAKMNIELDKKDENKFLSLNLMNQLKEDNIENDLDKSDKFFEYDKLDREMKILEKLIEIKEQYKMKNIPTGLSKKLKGVKKKLIKESKKFDVNKKNEMNEEL